MILTSDLPGAEIQVVIPSFILKLSIPRKTVPKELGFGITVEPTGAFYILANAKRFSKDSYRLAFDILQEAKVGVAPVIDFGSNAEGYLRFCYANSLENIEEGVKRLEKYLKKYQK